MKPVGIIYQAISGGYDKKPMLGYVPEEHVVVETRRQKKKGILWNREQKICHPPTECRWSIYLDGSLTPAKPLRSVVEKTWLKDAEMALFKHPWRDCAYDEIDACVKVKKLTPEQGEEARSALKSAGFPRHWGLWACGMIARRSDSEVHDALGKVWWKLVQNIPRDQIWLPCVLWKLKAMPSVHTIEADVFKNQFFKYRRHGN